MLMDLFTKVILIIRVRRQDQEKYFMGTLFIKETSREAGDMGMENLDMSERGSNTFINLETIFSKECRKKLLERRTFLIFKI
jgi:hypothetical protein